MTQLNSTPILAATLCALGLGTSSLLGQAQPENSSTKKGNTMATISASEYSSRHALYKEAIRPFKVSIRKEKLLDLRRRIAATQWPEKETVADQSQGVPLATMRELAHYWATDYDWRMCEAKLNKAAIGGMPLRSKWLFRRLPN